jgi:hypothetical protein
MRCSIPLQCCQVLFYLHLAIKRYSDVFFNKPAIHGTQNISLHILSKGTAVLCLCVPILKQGVCETSPSDAIHITVRIA